MVAVYCPTPVSGFQVCQAVHANDQVEIMRQLDGQSREAAWRPFEVTIVDQDAPDGEGVAAVRYEYSDAPWYSAAALVFRKAAIRSIESLLLRYGELLPLRCREADLVIYNPLCVVDCLDEAASGLMKASAGNIVRVTRHVFRESVVEGHGIFRIPRMRISATYFTGEAAQEVMSAGLKGFRLYRAWDSVTGTGDSGPWFAERR